MNTRAKVIHDLKNGVNNTQLSLGRSGTFMELVYNALDPECQVSPRVALQHLVELLEYTDEDMALDPENGIYVTAARVRACILNNIPESRERSLALTKLDECEMWAERALKSVKEL